MKMILQDQILGAGRVARLLPRSIPQSDSVTNMIPLCPECAAQTIFHNVLKVQSVLNLFKVSRAKLG